MCGRTAMNFNEDELRAELARANVQVNQVRNEPAWRRTYFPLHPLNNLSHNVAPTYNQPVLRQVGDRNNPGTQDVLPAVEAANEAPADASAGSPPTSPTSSSKAKPGDLIIQSMRYCLSGLS